MKTTKEIEILLYNLIKGSELEKSVSGVLTHVGRPANSIAEDICISVKSGTSGQFQSFVCDVNVYVPMLNADVRKYQNSSRIVELMKMCIPLFDKITTNGYRIEYDETPSVIHLEDADEDCINNRLVLTHINFE